VVFRSAKQAWFFLIDYLMYIANVCRIEVRFKLIAVICITWRMPDVASKTHANSLRRKLYIRSQLDHNRPCSCVYFRLHATVFDIVEISDTVGFREAREIDDGLIERYSFLVTRVDSKCCLLYRQSCWFIGKCLDVVACAILRRGGNTFSTWKLTYFSMQGKQMYTIILWCIHRCW